MSHRLITRGTVVKSIVPEVKNMSEIDFYSLMSDVLILPEVAKRISATVQQGASEIAVSNFHVDLIKRREGQLLVVAPMGF